MSPGPNVYQHNLALLSILAILLLPAVIARAATTQEGTDPKPVEVTRTTTPSERLAVNDEIDTLEAEIKPPQRYATYRPDFRVEERTFVFTHANGTNEAKRWRLVLDGSNIVALLRSGDISLIAFTPAGARTNIGITTGRYHLDNLLGPSISTWPLLQSVKTHGSIYKEQGMEPRDTWEGDGRSLTLVRSQKTPDRVVTNRYTITLDPVYGYRIDGVLQASFTNQPKRESLGFGTFCPGCYTVWPDTAVYDRTVYTHGNKSGYTGWANNLLCMDRCDGGAMSIRDNGFIAYLDQRSGLSPCFTRQDGAGVVGMSVCNAHNDFHKKLFVPELKQGADGLFRYKATYRLFALPAEMTTRIWEKMELIQQGVKSVIVRFPDEDFERQPVLLTEPTRGLVWTSGEPEVSTNTAHSGRQSIFLKAGRSWPNLPQVSLKPGTRYRLEGWFRVEPWTTDELAAAKAADEKNRAALEKAGKPLPPAVDWASVKPKAYIEGDFYQWSPHSEQMLVKQRTSDATGVGVWERVLLDFTTPAWDPFINIAFNVEYGSAYFDDFRLEPAE